MNWDKLIDRFAKDNPKVAIRLAILDRQIPDGNFLDEKQTKRIIESTNKLVDEVMKDYLHGTSSETLEFSPTTVTGAWTSNVPYVYHYHPSGLSGAQGAAGMNSTPGANFTGSSQADTPKAKTGIPSAAPRIEKAS